MSRDVDALWQALKSQQAPARRSTTPLSGLTGIPGITSSVRTYDKSRGPAKPSPKPSFIAQLGEGAKGQGALAATPADHQALLATLQRDINGLSDPDRSVRRRAAEKLHAALLGSTHTSGAGGSGQPVPPEALQAAMAGPLLVPLVRLLADPSEKCRELGVGFLAAALPRLPVPGALLPTLLPALQERVGSLPPQEPSEELRLALAELVAGPVLANERAPRPFPADLLPGLAATLCCQLQDAYADIKKAACTAVGCLAGLVGPGGLPPTLLQPLVLDLATDLAHQHSRVRLASLQALHALVHQHGMPQALMQDIVLPAVRPVAHDHSPAIRAALFGCVAQWAGSQLPSSGARSSSASSGSSCMGGVDADDEGRAANQCRTFLPLLLSLLLVGLTDDVEAVRTDTYQQLEAIGARMAGQAGCSSQDDAPSPSVVADQPGQLPGYCHPFSRGRPSLAARWLVLAQLSRLLQQSLAELREWTVTLRASAARLLRATLIYGEAEVLPQLPTVVQALRTAVGDDDAGVAMHAVGCVHVLGVNLLPRHWMPLATELVAAEQQTVAQRTAALVVLSGLLYAAAKTRAELDSSCLQLAAATLSSAQLVAAASAAADSGAPLRQQLLAACSNLALWAGPAAAPIIGPPLFPLLLQLWAAEADGAANAAAAAELAAANSGSAATLSAAAVLAQLAAALGRASAADLCVLYGTPLLHDILQGHEQWTHVHPSWRTLSALLRLGGSDALQQLWPAALPALQLIAADHEQDPRLRLELLQLAAALLEDDSKAPAWQQGGAGQQLVRGLLLPALVWRAGRLPAAVRYAALTAVATLLARHRLPAAQLLPLAVSGEQVAAAEGSVMTGAVGTDGGQAVGGLLAQLAASMDEDYEPDTRQLACYAAQLLLEAVGPQLPAPQLAALQPDLLRRLDDSSNRVRVAACGALQPWLVSMLSAARGGDGGLPAGDAASLASSMLLHMGDPDPEVSQAACAVLEQLAVARPAAVRPMAEAAAAAGQHPNAALLSRVLAACGAS